MNSYRFGRFEVRPSQRVVLVDGAATSPGARAFDVLLALLQHRDRVVSKDELLDMAWPGVVVEENNLQAQVSALRKLLGPQAIVTIPARGYRFALEVEKCADREAMETLAWRLVAQIREMKGAALAQSLQRELGLSAQ